VWLDVPYAEKDAAKSLGACWDPSARRWYAPERRGAQLQAWTALPGLPDPLPGEDRNFGSGLFVDLIPTSCWFTKVRRCVRPADWDRVKALVVGRAGHRCERCGTAAEPAHGLWLEAHERWSYDDTSRVQTLRRLVCLCTRCHRTHVGFAEVTGHCPQAHAHLRTVNGWSITGADAHIAMAVPNLAGPLGRGLVARSEHPHRHRSRALPRTHRPDPPPHRHRHPGPHHPRHP